MTSEIRGTAALKPTPKTEETALLRGFVSRFCYVKIPCFVWSFLFTKRLAVDNLCHEFVGYRR